MALLARPSLRGVPPPPLPPPTPLLLLLTSLVLRMSGLLLPVGSAAAARARVARVVEVAVGVVVGAADEVVEAVEVVAAVGVVAGLGALVAAVVAAVGVAVVAAVGVVAVGVELSRGEVLAVASGSSSSVRARPLCPSSFLLKSGVAIFDLDYDAILAATMYALSVSAEGDYYLCVPPDLGIEAVALGASESALPGTAPAEALHTFTLDSGVSRCFFRDITTLTPLSTPLPIRLADPSGGAFLARSSTVLPCPAVPSGSLSGLHLPSFSTNLVSTAALLDAMVTTTTPGGQRVSICSIPFLVSPPDARDSPVALPTWSPVPARLSWHALPPPCLWSSQVSASPPALACPPCLPCVEGRQCTAPHSSSFPPTTPPLQTLHMDVKGPAGDRPVMRLRSDRGGEFSSNLLRDFFRGEGILQTFTLLASPQENGIVEHRISLLMEVAPQPLALCLLAGDLVTLRWTGKVGDASVFRVWRSCAFVRDTSADKRCASPIPYVFLGFPLDALGWQFYHPTSRRVLPSEDVMFD
ncbi:unnamed protein product [Closterium sp. NIES-53]